MKIRNLTELARYRDRLSHLYLERGHIEQHDRSIAFVAGEESIPIPAADLALLLLGPGTTITHAAIRNLADCNCLVVWCGEEGVRFYAGGRGGTHLATNLLRQVELYAHPRSRARVVRRMYAMRFAEALDTGLTIQQVRGREGHRVREAYRKAALECGVDWKGRNYDAANWDAGDPLNRALSAGSACLNGLVHAALLSAGYSPAIGFIHTGKMLSFVYDIADLYKIDLIVPIAFRLVAEGEDRIESRVRHSLRDEFHRVRLLERILPDIDGVLSDDDLDPGTGSDESTGRPDALDDRAEDRDIPWPHDREGP